MFDGLRDPENDRQSFQEAMGFGPTASVQTPVKPGPARKGLLGMSAAQRFVLALMLLLAVSVLGVMCLLVAGVIAPP